jgi:hypothetical protein
MSEFANFSPDGYAAMINDLRDRGYECRPFADADPAARHLILRHDIDFSLSAARTMADVEAKLGVRSSYFVLLRTEFYNPLSADGLATLAHIASLGHELGLHFDADLYSGDDASIEAAATRECSLLETALERPVTVMSFHRPASQLIGTRNRIAGRLNAYGVRFIKDMGYCSDSRGAWYYGEPAQHPAVRAGRALQVLTHPFWWQAPAMAPLDRLKQFLAERTDLLDSELERNCSIYR